MLEFIHNSGDMGHKNISKNTEGNESWSIESAGPTFSSAMNDVTCKFLFTTE